MQVLYTYDDSNRVTEISQYVDGLTDEMLMDNVQYNTKSPLTYFIYRNDLQATFPSDSRDRLATLDVKNSETTFLDLDYTSGNNNTITPLSNSLYWSFSIDRAMYL